MTLKMLNFELYRCEKLKKISINIDLQWDAIEKKLSDVELKYILKRIYDKSILKKGDILKIFSHTLEVKNLLSKELRITLSDFLQKLNDIIKIEENIDIKVVFELFYENILIFYKDKKFERDLYTLADTILKKSKNIEYFLSKKGKLFISLKSSEKDIIEYFTAVFISKRDEYLKDIFQFEVKYYIGRNTELFGDIISKLLTVYIKDIVLYSNFEVNKILLDIFKQKFLSVEKKIRIYKGILQTYVTIKKFNMNTDIWFYDILNNFGPVNRRTFWKMFTSEQKSIFNKWFLMQKLDEFFGRNVKDPERLEFWKNYAYCMKKIEFYEELAQAIIMEFEEHTILEFGRRGNAAYVYPKEVFDIQTVENYLGLNSCSLIIYKLKNIENAIPLKVQNVRVGWNHSSNWQEVFKFRLRELGYKMEGV